MKKFFVTFFSLLCVLASAVGLAACGGSTEGGKPHEHVFSSQWSHNETHHWHAATCEHTDEVKDKAEHDFANGECVCGYKLPDKTAALISFFEKNFADKVFGDKTVYAQTAYADEENDALKGITVVYTYETTELDRAVELAQLSFEPIAVADIISGSAAAPQSELTRTTVFEFDAKDNHDRQDVADAVYAAYKTTSDIKIFNQTQSTIQGYLKMMYLAKNGNMLILHQFDVSDGETEDELIQNIFSSEFRINHKEISSHTVNGTLIINENYSYEKLDQVKIRYRAIKENNETVGFKLSEIYDKTITSFEIPAEYYGKPVTELAEGVFDGCDALQSITVDENNSAYASADGILYNKEKTQILAVPQAITGKVTLADGVTELAANTFADCTALTEIVLPNGLQTIGDNAFKGCSFTEVSLPESVTQVYGAFTDCNALEKLSLPNCNHVLGAYFGSFSLEQQKDSIPDSLKTVIIRGGDTVKERAFYECGLLESVIIPDSVTTIGSSAFYGCNSLESVTIPDSVTTIGSSAFGGCDFTLVLCKAPSAPSGWNADFANGALAVIYDCDNNDADADGNIYAVQNGLAYKIKDNAASVIAARIASDGIVVVSDSITHKDVAYTVTSIGTFFKYNRKLTKLTLGSGIANIAYDALEGCEMLESITVSADNPHYASIDGVLYNKEKTDIVKVPLRISGSITSPEGVTKIKFNAFRDCMLIERVNIPSSVKIIEGQAFYNCYSLQSLIVPTTVERIYPGALYGCSRIKSLTFAFSALRTEDVSGLGTRLRFPLGAIFFMTDNPGSAYSATEQQYYKYVNGQYTLVTNTFYIPNSLESVTITGSSVYEGSFHNCKNLKNVVIAETVTTIYKNSFKGCSNLETLTIPFTGESASVPVGEVNHYPFGSIFGSTPYEGSVEVEQSYISLGAADSPTHENQLSFVKYYIPQSLKTVRVTNEPKPVGQVDPFNFCNGLFTVIYGKE